MDDRMYAKVYAACLWAAIMMGDQMKELSWFGRNHAKSIRK